MGVKGKRMAKVLEELSDQHLIEMIPHRTEVRSPQIELFAGRAASHVTMGDFYEMLTQALFGGTRGTLYDDGSWIKPDLESDLSIREVKSCRAGHGCNILDAQMIRYIQLQVLNPEKEVSYVFYRHDFRGIMGFKGGVEEINAGLAAKTYYGLMLPLEVVLELHRAGVEKRLTDLVERYPRNMPPDDALALYGAVPQYGDGPYPPCSILRSATLNELFADPVAMLSLLGSPPDRFLFERTRTPQVSVEGVAVRPMPFLSVRHEDHAGWMRRFIQGYNPQRLFSESDERIAPALVTYGPTALPDDDIPF